MERPRGRFQKDEELIGIQWNGNPSNRGGSDETHIQDRNHDVRHGAGTAAIGLGCASSPPLRTEASTSGIRAAEEVGAAKVPQASLHLQLAKEELEHAKALARITRRSGSVDVVAC